MGIEITYRKKQDAMKKVIFLLFCLLVLSAWSNAENADDTFTVYQMNLWHEGSKVPNDIKGFLMYWMKLMLMWFFSVRSETLMVRCLCLGFWKI